MPFQFLCPQGHVLQGEESLVGQACQCPYCGSQFLVPAPVSGPGRPPLGAEGASSDSGGGFAAVSGGEPFFPPSNEDIVHLVCPKGHTLDTPREMLGMDAVCPFCQTVFSLRWEDSLEYRRQQKEKEQRAQIRQQQLARSWLHWSIAVAVVVILGVILMVVMSI
jgi:uncharacterized Zn-finger protein